MLIDKARPVSGWTCSRSAAAAPAAATAATAAAATAAAAAPAAATAAVDNSSRQVRIPGRQQQQADRQ